MGRVLREGPSAWDRSPNGPAQQQREEKTTNYTPWGVCQGMGLAALGPKTMRALAALLSSLVIEPLNTWVPMPKAYADMPKAYHTESTTVTEQTAAHNQRRIVLKG